MLLGWSFKYLNIHWEGKLFEYSDIRILIDLSNQDRVHAAADVGRDIRPNNGGSYAAQNRRGRAMADLGRFHSLNCLEEMQSFCTDGFFSIGRLYLSLGGCGREAETMCKLWGCFLVAISISSFSVLILSLCFGLVAGPGWLGSVEVREANNCKGVESK